MVKKHYDLLDAQDSASTSAFMRLPRRIRLQICFYVGILGHPRPRNRLFVDLGSWGAPDHNHGRQRFVNTYKLLLTCKSIYHDLHRLVYGFNHCYVRLDYSGKLGGLRRLRPDTLFALRWLTIHVNVSSCGLGSLCESYVYPWRHGLDQSYDRLSKPLSLANQDDKVSILPGPASYTRG
jgi:hypothetical protein